MSVKNWDGGKFRDGYSRALYNAVRKASYEIGKDVIDIFRDDGLPDTKPTRQKRVQYKVRKNNTLAFIDRGYDARIREYGATIRPKGGGGLVIPFDGSAFREQARRDKAKGRTRKTFMLKRAGQDPLIMQKDSDGKSRPIAILKREVERPALHPEDKLSYLANKGMEKFEGLVGELVEKEWK